MIYVIVSSIEIDPCPTAINSINASMYLLGVIAEISLCSIEFMDSFTITKLFGMFWYKKAPSKCLKGYCLTV